MSQQPFKNLGKGRGEPDGKNEPLMNKYRLPKDTAEFLKHNKRDNFGLMMEKAGEFRTDKFWLMNESRTGLIHPFKKNDYKAYILALNRRLSVQIEALKSQGYAQTEHFDLTLTNRMVVGLGEESVYETGMTLHPVYGMPYIPASAIKGMLRNFIINELFWDEDKNKASEELALKDPVFCQIFGCPEESIWKKARKGSIIFFDALPKGEVTVKADVMTPHYGEYYMDEKGKIPPADWLEPVPITFLTVEKTKFTFAYAVREDVPKVKYRKAKGTEEKEPIEPHDAFAGQSFSQIVDFWLPKALNEQGIGAKTAVGYGMYEKVEIIDKP